jgi:hypothetical protein
MNISWKGTLKGTRSAVSQFIVSPAHSKIEAVILSERGPNVFQFGGGESKDLPLSFVLFL